MQGFASKEQLMAAREVINALSTLDKMTRLDAGTATEITETRSLDAVASDFDALLREVASNPPDGVKRG